MYSRGVLGGYEQHDNGRLVVDNLFGFEVAQADFDSFFLSPSATLGKEFRLNKEIALRPSATVTYSAGWYDSYSEYGTTRSNLSEFELRGGARYRYTMNATSAPAWRERHSVTPRQETTLIWKASSEPACAWP